MTRKRTAPALSLVVVALIVAGCGGDGDEAASPDTETATTIPETVTEAGAVLKGSVGPGFVISLTTEDGTPVETLTAGSYTLEIEDKSDIHNFRLTGPMTNLSTGIETTRTMSWDIQLGLGEYTFVCDPHANTMKGSFEVSG